MFTHDQISDDNSDTSDDAPEPSLPSNQDVINALDILKHYADCDTSARESVASTEVVNHELIIRKQCIKNKVTFLTFSKCDLHKVQIYTDLYIIHIQCTYIY